MDWKIGRRGGQVKVLLKRGYVGGAVFANSKLSSSVAPGFQDGASSSPRSSWLGNFLDSLAHFEASTLSINKM